MTEVKISKKTNEYLKEGKYHTVIVTLEKDCSCVGNSITGLRVEVSQKKEKEIEGYTCLKADDYKMFVDKRLSLRPKVSVYLNEGKGGNILDIEGIEL